MNTLEYLIKKYGINFDDKVRMPIEIPDVGRNNLAQWLHELNFKTGVEVGVAAGDYSQTLSDANPQMKLYGVDPYVPYEDYPDFREQSVFSNRLKEANKRLAGRPNFEFIKEFSLNAIKRFTDNSLDFVYIDANHQEPFVTQDITEWYKKVRPGGIIAGHDYGKPKDNDGITVIHNVRRAVRNCATQNHIKPWFTLGTTKPIKGHIRDNPRTWMWVKP